MEKRIALEKRGLPDDKVSAVRGGDPREDTWSSGGFGTGENRRDSFPTGGGKSNLFLLPSATRCTPATVRRFISRVSLLGCLLPLGRCVYAARTHIGE